MLDAKMLESVNETLKLIEELDSKTDIELREILKECVGTIDNLSRQEIINQILRSKLKPQDFMYYEKYLYYLQNQRVQEFSDSLDTLTDLSSKIDSIQQDKRRYHGISMQMSERANKTKMGLRNIPMIRARIESSHVVSRKDDYVSKRTRVGMSRANIIEEMESIQKSGFIIRNLKKRKATLLKEKLQAYDKEHLKEVDENYELFAKEIKEYCNLLRELFYNMLKNRDVCVATMQATRLYNHTDIQYDEDDLGIKLPSAKEIEEVDKEVLYQAFLNFANFNNMSADDITAELYYEQLQKFVLYYINTIIGRMETKTNLANNEITTLCEEQKGVVNSLKSRQMILDVNSDLTEDENETLSLLYSSKK